MPARPAPNRTRAESPARWMAALERAIDANVRPAGRVAAGVVLVPSATDAKLVYATDGVRCACASAASGDPICWHRAIVRAARGMAPFAPDPEPAAPALCPACKGFGYTRKESALFPGTVFRAGCRACRETGRVAA
jgi:hypothetical protein